MRLPDKLKKQIRSAKTLEELNSSFGEIVKVYDRYHLNSMDSRYDELIVLGALLENCSLISTVKLVSHFEYMWFVESFKDEIVNRKGLLNKVFKGIPTYFIGTTFGTVFTFGLLLGAKVGKYFKKY